MQIKTNKDEENIETRFGNLFIVSKMLRHVCPITWFLYSASTQIVKRKLVFDSRPARIIITPTKTKAGEFRKFCELRARKSLVGVKAVEGNVKISQAPRFRFCWKRKSFSLRQVADTSESRSAIIFLTQNKKTTNLKKLVC